MSCAQCRVRCFLLFQNIHTDYIGFVTRPSLVGLVHDGAIRVGYRKAKRTMRRSLSISMPLGLVLLGTMGLRRSVGSWLDQRYGFIVIVLSDIYNMFSFSTESIAHTFIPEFHQIKLTLPPTGRTVRSITP
jgi:hypothetical protein